jgi:hypothetical protein
MVSVKGLISAACKKCLIISNKKKYPNHSMNLPSLKTFTYVANSAKSKSWQSNITNVVTYPR